MSVNRALLIAYSLMTGLCWMEDAMPKAGGLSRPVMTQELNRSGTEPQQHLKQLFISWHAVAEWNYKVTCNP